MNRRISDYGTNWKVACYIRLSKEDEKNAETKRAGGESESIINQRNLLLRYVEENNLFLVGEYVDDGFSGTTFDRPQFNKMKQDIENGKINMVITKDMSRLGRDYIETGHYMEKYFPEKRVRYISLLDNVDTFLDSNNDIAPFKAVINDMYSKDLSKKIRSTLLSKKEQGMFLGKVAPYGYQKSIEDKHKLVIDPIASEVVKEIFSMFINGIGTCEIASTLSERKIPIPSVHNKITVGNPSISYGLWSNTGVRRIVANEVYTGTLVQNKYTKLNYKSRKLLLKDEDVWIKTPNAHEAIISIEDYKTVQRILIANAGVKPSKNKYLLSGLLRCYNCGSFIALYKKDKRYGWIYGHCGRYAKYSKFKLCTTHSFNYTKLEEWVLERLKEICVQYLDIESATSVYYNSLQKKNDVEAKVKMLEIELSKIDKRIDLLYDDRINGIIPEEDFRRISMKANDDRRNLESQIDLLKSENKPIDRKHYEKVAKEFLSLESPSFSLIAQMIDRIEIHEGQEYDIYYRFPEFQSISEAI